jgi:Helix-turn-helix domain
MRTTTEDDTVIGGIKPENYYKRQELAEILRVRDRTIDAMRRRGLQATALSPGGRSVRFLGSDVIAFLEEQRAK